MILGYQETARVMGVTATLTVHAKDAPHLVQVGNDLLTHYERLWSRFLPHSDITRLNNANGAVMEVDPETSQLVATMIAAHRETHGLFNPTLLPMQMSHGDRKSLVSDAVCSTSDAVHPWEDLDGITFHSPTSLSIPKQMTLDAGGMAKGFAADRVALALMQLGASSVSVNIGGDARVMASDESTHDWNFDVCDTQGTHIWSTVSLHEGAIATSSMDARHRLGCGPTHHLFSIDNTPSEIALCSVIAANATWAEAWTKLLFFSTDLCNDIQQRDLAVFIVDTQGNTFFSEKWKGYTL
mgnify:CR=1 FL=1